ncbi:hypothetical protein AB0J21_04535 [Streptomyces sp. NPDC049954]|uniref:phosphotransferase-like protein n=1 Tax=Streptomyces sp. NPDC049954 TaxID=3155779 RepID=UPI003422DD37
MPRTPRGGRVVLLNGASSSGKSSIARELLDLLEGSWLAVRCPLPELEHRERARGDREPGLAAAQYEVVHAHGVHDVDVDTSTLSPHACALRVRDHLEHPARPTAFEALRAEPRP